MSMTEQQLIDECAFAQVVSLGATEAILIAGRVIEVKAPLDIGHLAVSAIVTALRRGLSDSSRKSGSEANS